jgi:hypothetical protein
VTGSGCLNNVAQPLNRVRQVKNINARPCLCDNFLKVLIIPLSSQKAR